MLITKHPLSVEVYIGIKYAAVAVYSVILVIFNMNTKGIWLYGLAGSGKSYGSNIISNSVSNSFIIDGDNVRAKISTDLGYTVEDRLIQIQRIYGIAMLAMDNDQFPVISSVYMTANLAEKCQKIGIKVIHIVRDKNTLKKIRKIYTAEENVVGKDIDLEKIDTLVIKNFGDQSFSKELLLHVD